MARLPKCAPEAIIPDGPGDLVAVDFYGPLPKSVGGVTYLYVVLDVFSKLVTLYPVKRATTATIVKRMTDYFANIGKPRRLLCDHGTQFTASAWRTFLDRSNVALTFSSIRHPQGNPSERVMRELNRLFRTYRRDKHKGWARDIPLFQQFMNSVVHESTGYAPCELHFGRPPETFLRLGNELSVPVPDNHVKIFLANRTLRRRARRRVERDVGAVIPDQDFKIGDLVLIRNTPVPSDPLNETKKFLPLFEGPYRLAKQVGTKTFVLVWPETGVQKGQYHLSHFRAYHPPSLT